jgi:hypothetical protein
MVITSRMALELRWVRPNRSYAESGKMIRSILTTATVGVWRLRFPQRTTGQKALKQLEASGQIRRVGVGIASRPFRYFLADKQALQAQALRTYRESEEAEASQRSAASDLTRSRHNNGWAASSPEDLPSPRHRVRFLLRAARHEHAGREDGVTVLGAVAELERHQACNQPLREELNDSRFEVVHRSCNLYAAAGF